MSNKEVRLYAKFKDVKFWEIANAINVSESTLTRWFRDELPEEQKTAYMRLIDLISKGGKLCTGTEVFKPKSFRNYGGVVSKLNSDGTATIVYSGR